MCAAKTWSIAEKQAALFKDFIRKKRVMIVDSQAYSRAALAQSLQDLGAVSTQITLESNFVSAQATIARQCPDILITEFDLEGGACGLDLLAAQRKTNQQSKQSIFILVTSNTSQAAVARAAEEDVDGYLLKPYTFDGLRLAIMKYANEKAYPPPYTQTIERGKEKLAAAEIDEALAIFQEAQALDPKPSLACFYHGITEEYRKTLSNAEGDYNKGLNFNKIHYKCLVGLFELYMSQKRNKEAYEIVRRISRYFPANPDRLATVLRLAVMNEAYEDIERYYALFTKLDQRNEMLTRYVTAALIVCGKYYLARRANGRAVELFNRAMATGARNPRLLKEMISSLLQYDLVAEATHFFRAWPPEAQGAGDYRAMKYAIEDRQLTDGTSIAHGRDLIHDGVKELVVYSILIRRSASVGYTDHAEQLLAEAIKLWPDKEPELRQVFNRAKKATG